MKHLVYKLFLQVCPIAPGSPGQLYHMTLITLQPNEILPVITMLASSYDDVRKKNLQILLKCLWVDVK